LELPSLTGRHGHVGGAVHVAVGGDFQLHFAGGEAGQFDLGVGLAQHLAVELHLRALGLRRDDQAGREDEVVLQLLILFEGEVVGEAGPASERGNGLHRAGRQDDRELVGGLPVDGELRAGGLGAQAQAAFLKFVIHGRAAVAGDGDFLAREGRPTGPREGDLIRAGGELK